MITRTAVASIPISFACHFTVDDGTNCKLIQSLRLVIIRFVVGVFRKVDIRGSDVTKKPSKNISHVLLPAGFAREIFAVSFLRMRCKIAFLLTFSQSRVKGNG